MTNTTNTAPAAAEVITKQVASWRSEVARLQDLISHATGTVPAGIDLDKLEALARAATPDNAWPFNVNVFRNSLTPATVLALISLARRAAEAAPAADERALFEYAERASNLARDEDCPEDYANPCVQSAWEGWQARIALIQQSSHSPAPECAMCNDSGIVGFPPDQYEECPDCIKARAASSHSPAAVVAATDDTRQIARDAVAGALTGLYYCRRVWSAWSVGTMSEDDFSPADEDDDIIENVTDAAINAMILSGVGAPPAPVSTPAQVVDALTDEQIWEHYKALDLPHVPVIWQAALGTVRSVLAASPAAAPETAHADDLAVDRFAAAMKAKMAQKRAEGRGGWDDKNTCSAARLQVMLVEHLAKGDPVDIGNFAMMLWNRGEPVAAVAPSDAKGKDDDVKDLWIHDDMDRDGAATIAGMSRKEMKAAYINTVENMIAWRRRALAAEASKGKADAAIAGGLSDEQIMRIAGDVRQHNAGTWPGDVAFARAVLANQSPATSAADAKDAEHEEWSYSTDEERYHEQEPSRLAIIEHALGEIESADDGQTQFWIGRNVRFVPRTSVASIIESLQEQAHEECGEFAETYLDDVTQDEESELEDIVNAWAERVDRSNFWTVTNVEHFTIESARAAMAASRNGGA